ncbi:hypothetical protein [Antarctobacter heliothermus]|uniref:Uncharacterized protein n=1 Tax=Antarctobacter heliothermus TaxID=74033 RepID=A0A239ERF7_9RHOB|nr:hypothetical protein [Antarctobacter heliothermus]SNS46848.1 hypothetical protein SAMN04488078_101632 [Antarctobacter heliothermus]
MFTVTPIGSCRIATPLRLGQSTRGIRLNLNRSYGYCHSPAEAVQLARFLRGEMTISADVWPLVSRSHQLATLSSEIHVPSGLYVIELASAKELTIDGVSIQLNYLKSTYPDFFADPDRMQAFWDAAQTGDRARTTAFLDKAWSATDAQRADSAVLSRITLNYVTPDSLAQDIQTLGRLLPDVMFVSHVNARKPDGQTIKSRASLVTMVSDGVRDAGFDLYDPTQLMAEFGQPAAIEDDSTSLAHFTTPFSTAVMDDWMARFIAPRTDAAVASGTVPAETLRAQIDAACTAGHFAEATSRLSALSTRTEEYRPFGKKVHRAQKAAQAVFHKDLSAKAASAKSLDMANSVQTAGRLGLFETARLLATDAEDRFVALPCHILTDVALRAEAAGDIASAAQFAIAACRQHDTADRAAQVLADLVVAQQIDLSDRLEPTKLAKVQSCLSVAGIEAALTHADAPIKTLISSHLSATDLTKIAAGLAEKRGVNAAAHILAHWRDLHDMPRLRDKGVIALLDAWTNQATQLQRPLDRIRALIAIQQADPRHKAVREALRTAKIDLATRYRAAGKARDWAALSALAAEVQAIAIPLPEYDLWRARVQFDDGDFARAIAYGCAAAEQMPDRINVWVLLMRAAVKTGDSSLAARSADRVIALSDEATEKLRAQAEAVQRKLLAEV